MKKKILGFLIVLSFVFSGISVYADDPAPVDSTPPVDPIPQETILIRDGATVVYSGVVDLPAAGTLSVVDANAVSHDVNTRSVLGVLYALDQQNDSFSISNLQYYDSFGAFYLKCITAVSSESCDNWQYTVNGTTPFTGIDTTNLAGGETIGIYFGSPYRIVFDKNTTTTESPIDAHTQSYNYLDDTWGVRAGVTVGITQPDPNNPWSPVVISEIPVDTNGDALLSFGAVGEYNIGVKEDYYFPSYPITVTAPVSGGGGGGISASVFSVSNASGFLFSKQHGDGSWGDMLYTDWAAIAAGVSNSPSISVVKNYLQSTPFASSVVTDNERHAMALMALNIDPYIGSTTNYIEKITASFDGVQIGDSTLINDDIFGLIVLKKAGYSPTDTIIVKDLAYVVAAQGSDGSFGGSIDMTAAAINALYAWGGNDDAIHKALTYLASKQNPVDGGFGNTFATSWAMQALSVDNTFSNALSQADVYMAHHQQVDGGLEDTTTDIDNRVWATSYALPAILHKTFVDSLYAFPKYSMGGASGGSSGSAPDTSASKPIESKKEIVPLEEIKIEPVKEILLKKNTEVLKKKNDTKKERTIKNATKEQVSAPIENVVPAGQLSLPLSASAADSISEPFMQSVKNTVYTVLSGVKRSILRIASWF